MWTCDGGLTRTQPSMRKINHGDIAPYEQQSYRRVSRMI